jgi:uncharacterized protein (TIGR02466 family)
MSQVINLCSVPVYVDSLPNEHRFTRSEIDILKNIQMNKQYGEDGNYLSEDIHILQKYSLTRIYDLCDHYVNHYVKNILSIDAKFTMFKSWLSMNETGTKHLAHSHRNTMISCIMYFDEYMSDQAMAPINFGQPGLDSIFKTFQFHFKTLKTSQYNSSLAKVIPKTGTVIVFPGWIQHETDEAQSNIKRYCLGTNYFFEGESSNGYHNIKIKVDTE